MLVLVAGLALAALPVVALRAHWSATEVSTPVVQSDHATASASEQALVPTPAQVGSARIFAAERSGDVSFAVVDTSGTLACFRCRVRYHSASVVKAMLLVAYLNRLAEDNETLPADHEAYLNSMIRVSDNEAATAIYAHVGDKRLYELASQAQMSDFHVSGTWGSARITAADQAHFFADLDELTAPEYRAYARALLSSIVREQSWGIPEVSRPEWRTFFKGGWLMTRRGNLVHQVARLEKGTASLAIAILTDGSPADVYGRETIRGLAERLLRR
jgi:Beta-lactamase enzyme family